MIRKALFVILFTLSSLSLNAQMFVGMTKDDVLKSMKSEKPDYVCDNSFRNDRYNYLKYLSDDGLETWIIVFDADDRCKAVRITYASGLLLQKRKELDAMYKKTGRDRWSLMHNKKTILVELKDETWYFTITYRQASKM